VISIVDFIEDSNLAGAACPKQETFASWKTALSVFQGEELETMEELDLFSICTELEEQRTTPYKDAMFIVGRRGGKGRIAAAIGAYLASIPDYSTILAPGEIGLLPIIASDKSQARIVLNYCRDIFMLSPILKQQVEEELSWEIRLKNRIIIRVMTCSTAAVRGWTLIGAILEEVGSWRSDGANPDKEILRAIRPGRLTTKGPIINISTPYRKIGILWDGYRKHFGIPSNTLVWKAPSLVMNPTLDREEIAEEMIEDPENARCEYECQWRTDIMDFLSLESVEDCIVQGRVELPPVDGIRYVAFSDPSGGRSDAAALAIGHNDGQRVVLDLARRWRAPHDPAAVLGEMALILRSYGLSRVTSDRYAAEWPVKEFARHYITCESSSKNKSELYLDLQPMINSGRVELLDNKQIKAELIGLERRTRSGGHDIIDHAPRAMDDLCNAVAGCRSILGTRPMRNDSITQAVM
jgi:hypothetical protein